MKNFGAFTQDGFEGSIELLRFLRDLNIDLQSAISALVGDSPVFIKGGEITQDGGDTTVTSGIIVKEGKLYSFNGSTYEGAVPGDLTVIFTEGTAAGYPQPFFTGDPDPKDIYLSASAAVGESAEGDVTAALTSITRLNVASVHDRVAAIEAAEESVTLVSIDEEVVITDQECHFKKIGPACFLIFSVIFDLAALKGDLYFEIPGDKAMVSNMIASGYYIGGPPFGEYKTTIIRRHDSVTIRIQKSDFSDFTTASPLKQVSGFMQYFNS